MTLNKSIREQARHRSNYACEYCGITETDTGGLLTIDHFRPKSKGGTDNIDNLIYCCNRCNSYKHNYYPEDENSPKIWNPREESFSQHFFLLDNGSLKSLTPVGKTTIQLLRLNRPSLISYRLQQAAKKEEQELLKRYQSLVNLYHQANQELGAIIKNQQDLLEQQQQILRFLLEEFED